MATVRPRARARRAAAQPAAQFHLCRARRLRLRPPRDDHPRVPRHRGPAAARRPQRHRQDLPAQHALRSARPRAPPLQREPDLVRRPGRLSVSRRGARDRALPRDAGHRVGRGVGADRRDLALQARAPEPAVLAGARAQAAGPAAEAPALPLGRDEPVHLRPGRHRGLLGFRAARPRARRPLCADRHGGGLERPHPRATAGDRRAVGRGQRYAAQ